MKFRIGTKYIFSVPQHHINSEQYIASLSGACKELGWDIKFISASGIIAYTPFRYNSGSEEITVRLENGIMIIKSESLGSQLHDWGKNEKNVNAFIAAYDKVKSTLTDEVVQAEMDTFKEILPQTEQDDILSPTVYAENEKKSGFLYLFIPRQGYYITPILLILNIIVFIAMCISGVNIMMPDTEAIANWGGNYGDATLNGEWWRLITCAFVHIGIFHLLMNMYALLYIGLFLEPLLGRSRFLAAYLLTGITSSILSLYMHPNIVSAGASGAIFGMYGVFLAMLTTNLIDKSARKAILPSIIIFIGYNLMNGMKDGVDNAGHIGGLLGGLLIGYAFYPSVKNFKSAKLKYSTILSMSVVVLALVFISFSKTGNSVKKHKDDIAQLEKRMQLFAELETKALKVYQLPDSTSAEALLYEIKEHGINYWNQCEALLTANDSVEIPESGRKLNNRLKQYVALRKQAYELAYKNLNEKTNIYTAKIDEINIQIDKILSELNSPQK